MRGGHPIPDPVVRSSIDLDFWDITGIEPRRSSTVGSVDYPPPYKSPMISSFIFKLTIVQDLGGYHARQRPNLQKLD